MLVVCSIPREENAAVRTFRGVERLIFTLILRMGRRQIWLVFFDCCVFFCMTHNVTIVRIATVFCGAGSQLDEVVSEGASFQVLITATSVGIALLNVVRGCA